MRFSAKHGVQKSPKLAKTVQDCPKLSGAVQKSPKLSSSALCFRHSGVLGENFCCEVLPTSPGLRRPSEFLHRRKSYPATLFSNVEYATLHYSRRMKSPKRSQRVQKSPSLSKRVQRSLNRSKRVQGCPNLSISGWRIGREWLRLTQTGAMWPSGCGRTAESPEHPLAVISARSLRISLDN